MKKHLQHLSLPDAETLFKWIREGELHEFSKSMKQGANPNSSNGNGFTLLHAAVRYNRPAFVELLLRKGADWKAKDAEGKDAEYYALAYGFERIASMFEKHRQLEKQAQELRNAQGWRYLGKRHKETRARAKSGNEGADMNATEKLFIAIEKRDADMADEALKEGASMSKRNQYGFPPLHYAAILGATTMFEFLLGKNPDLDITDHRGYKVGDYVYGETQLLLSKARERQMREKNYEGPKMRQPQLPAPQPCRVKKLKS